MADEDNLIFRKWTERFAGIAQAMDAQDETAVKAKTMVCAAAAFTVLERIAIALENIVENTGAIETAIIQHD